MARKSSRTKKTKKEKQLVWGICSVVSAFLMFFALTRMGLAGIVIDNFFTILLGSFYIVPIITLLAYFICILFFGQKIKFTSRTITGIVLFNVSAVLLSAYLAEEMSSFHQFGAYLSAFKGRLLDENRFSLSGGIIGNILYLALVSMVSQKGTLITLATLIVISLILMIPADVFRSTYSSVKTSIVKESKERKKKIEEARAAARKEAELKRAKLAEEMARLNEQEEERRQKEQERLEEERRIAKEKAQKEAQEKAKKEERERILSKSPTFINLNDKEIYGDRKPENNIQAKNEEETIIPGVSSDSTPKVLKVKKTSGTYHLPKPYEYYLETVSSKSSSINRTSASVKGEKVIEILKNFGINSELLNTYIGPSVTKFEIKPDSSVKINKIMNISDNIKMELAAKDIRIEAPIPGRSAVGIEIPNVEPIPVRMLDLIRNIPKEKRRNELLFALGKDLMGQGVYCDLTKMPHLLIAGATGSGKSVCINSIIVSLLLRVHPDSVKLVLVDPKKVEFTSYKDIPHLLWPIIDDAQMAANMLKKIVVIMEERYEAFAAAGVRNIDSFNTFVDEHNAHLKIGDSPMNRLPYMVVIIDELADLMAIAGKDVELSIQRITQLARASGIHLIVATQRPSTDVITGLIKSNIPSRISFAVASSIDSRTILDQTGAERLLGNGDMLYYPQGETAPIRLQGVYVTDKEIYARTDFVRSQAKPESEDSYYDFLTNMNGTTVMAAGSVNANDNDSLYDDVVEFVKAQQKASTSLLQRRFGIGYNRAARLIDTLEDRGIIGPANGAKPREVYIKEDEE